MDRFENGIVHIIGIFVLLEHRIFQPDKAPEDNAGFFGVQIQIKLLFHHHIKYGYMIAPAQMIDGRPLISDLQFSCCERRNFHGPPLATNADNCF